MARVKAQDVSECLRDNFIQLAASISQITDALDVSIPYAAKIRIGHRQPHLRHWKILAQLVGIEDKSK